MFLRVFNSLSIAKAIIKVLSSFASTSQRKTHEKNCTHLFLLFITQVSSAGGNQDLPVTAIVPNYITVGTEVFIGYDRGRFPCLEAFPNFQGLLEYIEMDEDNNIEITVSGVAQFPCFDYSSTIEQFQFYSLGVLPVGNYSIQVYWTDPGTFLPVPPDLNRFEIGETVQFEVHAPVIIPSLSHTSLIILMVFMILISLLFHREKPLKSINNPARINLIHLHKDKIT
jgi:hypothetical protein